MSVLPTYEEALARVLALIDGPLETERVSLQDASGRVLAEDVCADRDLPPFNRAMMDGYALRAADFAAGKPFPIAADIAAGASPEVQVPIGACVKVATGAAVPAGLDTVIQHERSDRGNPVRFTVESIEAGHAIHPRGADAKAGDVVVHRGTRLFAHHLGIAASVGRAMLSTCRLPRVAILTSGDEVRPPGETSIEAHHIRNSNGPMLAEAVARFGGDSQTSWTHVADDRNATIEAARNALGCDLVITVGGVSAGERDHFPAAYEALGFDMVLTGARIQPGKPVQAGRQRGSRATVIGLPGNPVSALVCAHLFVWPVLRRMTGDNAPLPWRSVTLREPVRPNPHRQAFRPACLHEDGDSVIVPKWAGSGDLAHTSQTHGIIALPMTEVEVAAGATVRFLPWA